MLQQSMPSGDTFCQDTATQANPDEDPANPCATRTGSGRVEAIFVIVMEITRNPFDAADEDDGLGISIWGIQ